MDISCKVCKTFDIEQVYCHKNLIITLIFEVEIINKFIQLWDVLFVKQS